MTLAGRAYYHYQLTVFYTHSIESQKHSSAVGKQGCHHCFSTMELMYSKNALVSARSSADPFARLTPRRFLAREDHRYTDSAITALIELVHTLDAPLAGDRVLTVERVPSCVSNFAYATTTSVERTADKHRGRFGIAPRSR